MFRTKSQKLGQKGRKSWGSRAVIEVLDDELHQIFPTPQLAQVVERSEDFEFLQQPENRDDGRLSARVG